MEMLLCPNKDIGHVVTIVTIRGSNRRDVRKMQSSKTSRVSACERVIKVLHLFSNVLLDTAVDIT